MFDTIHEECGVFGIYSEKTTDVAMSAYYALFALQHRGQESCGIAVNDDGVISCHKSAGLVNDVFKKDTLDALGQGQMAVGHVRYGTTGSGGIANAQPMVVNHIKGSMALAHNGNLTNSAELREALEMNGSIFHSTSDTEVISYIITKERISAPSIEAAVFSAMYRLKGAYSLIIMSPSKLIAARDPLGFRPLCIGKKDGQILFASETCALNTLGAEYVRDVRPGEVVIADRHGLRSLDSHCGIAPHTLCVFEYIYFARPDSVIEGTSVHQARVKAGKLLAESYPVDADVVVGVPDSGLDAALGYSQQSGVPYAIGFVKNKYIGRTFIQGNQKQRENSVRIKLNAVKATVQGKRVVLVDDSIVRGTTSARIIKLLRDAGAKEVHFRVSAPPFAYPCYFGTDIPDQKLLVATGHTNEEICKIIGADSLGYLSVDQAKQLAFNSDCGFCTGCFTGEWPIPAPVNDYVNVYDRPLSKSGKNKRL